MMDMMDMMDMMNMLDVIKMMEMIEMTQMIERLRFHISVSATCSSPVNTVTTKHSTG